MVIIVSGYVEKGVLSFSANDLGNYSGKKGGGRAFKFNAAVVVGRVKKILLESRSRDARSLLFESSFFKLFFLRKCSKL